MKKPAIFLLIVLYPLALLFGQPKNVTIQGMGGLGFGLFVPMMGSGSSNLEVLGTPYINDSWMFGSFTVSDSVKAEGLIRYNAYMQEMEIVYKSDTFMVTAPFRLTDISFSGKKFVHTLYMEERGKTEWLGSAYFEILNSGNLSLLRRNYVKVEENSFTRNYMGGGGDGREYYIHKSSLYFRPEPGAAAVKIDKGKRQVIELMKNHEKEVRGYIKENRLNLRKEEDMILLFGFFNKIA